MTGLTVHGAGEQVQGRAHSRQVTGRRHVLQAATRRQWEDKAGGEGPEKRRRAVGVGRKQARLFDLESDL
eukprot:scaffold260182_cov30-Prasinocladus_malaysianus.AAC.1